MSEPETPVQMPVQTPGQTLKITLDDLAAVTLPSTAASAVGAPGEASIYGSIHEAPDDPAIPQEKPSLWLRAWMYLGTAGLLGALAGWGICERAFLDRGDGSHGWGNTWLLPAIVALMCVAFGAAESLVERSWRKALFRLALALPLGVVFGFVFDFIANVLYNMGLGMLFSLGVQSFHNPAAWLVRGLAWAAFGAAGGVVYGIIGQSARKVGYGALGGAIGAMVGGVIFDPIAFATKGGAPSRGIGFALLGLATGVAMGLVESALKDRWLYVTAGPLAGKQFILYKPVTRMGANQQGEIYLFKDAEILPLHATLELKGSRMHLVPAGPVYVGGSPVRARYVLTSGANLRIGRYTFRYQEKQR